MFGRMFWVIMKVIPGIEENIQYVKKLLRFVIVFLLFFSVINSFNLMTVNNVCQKVPFSQFVLHRE